MKDKDKNGRPYVKLDELKVGDIIELDDGFDCAPPGKVEVFEVDGELCFQCIAGIHKIVGQADDGKHCIGIYGPL